MTTAIVSENDKKTVASPKDDTPMQSSPTYQLKIQKNPPSFVFMGEPFTIDFSVEEEDHNHPERLRGIQTSLREDGSLLPLSSESNCTKDDIATSDWSTTILPSFKIVVELFRKPTWVNTGHSMQNKGTPLSEKVPIVDDSTHMNVINPPAASRVLHGKQGQKHQSTLTLNLLQDLSSIPLGEIGTIQCSLTGENFGEDMCNEDHMVPIQQRIRATSQSTAISTLAWDTSSMTCQIRIIAFFCRNDEKFDRFDRHRNKSSPNKTKSAIALTSAITIVRHKIVITSCSNDVSSHGNNGSKNTNIAETNWNSVWYKDEGGRDKCMEIVVGVNDRQHMALFEAIPMLLTLCYASPNQQSLKHNSLSLSSQLPIPVTNQDILNVLSPKSKELFVLDRATGTMKIRFRVEDVSKNHQGQDFCLLIAAALGNGDYEYFKSYHPAMIAPAVSLSINVRSKRNKRPRQFTNISIPASDMSSEHVYPHDSVLPSLGTVLSPTVNSGAIVETRPKLASKQLQSALRNVVHWVQDVVTKTTFELQRQPPQSGISTHYLSSMAQSVATYHGQVQEQLNVLQYVADFNTSSPSRRIQSVPNDSQLMYSTHESSYQHPPTASNQFHSYETSNFPYYQAYYHESATPSDGRKAFYHRYPYQYQNQMYFAAPTTYQHHPTVRNEQHVEPHAVAAMHDGPHIHDQPTTRNNQPLTRNDIDYRAHEGAVILETTEKLPMKVNKRQQSKLQISQMNLQTSHTGDDRQTRCSVKNFELRHEYPSDARSFTSRATNDIVSSHSENRESEVAFVYAKQFKSLRTGTLLGYPAYTIQKELIGFYQQVQPPQSIDTSEMSRLGRYDQKPSPTQPPLFTRSHLFIPTQKEDFGVTELEHAKVVFDKADCSAIQAMSQCGSIESMLHRALVYEWSQGLTDV